MNRRLRPLSLSTAIATLVAYAGLSVFAAPARAADPDTLALRGLVTGLEAFVPGLAGVGRLAQPIPTLAVTPADGLGLATLLGEADTTVLGAAFDNADTVDQLVDAIDGADGTISDDRDVSFTASKTVVGTVTSMTVGVHAERTIASSKLGIADDSPRFSLAAEDGVRVDLTLDAGFVLNYDSATSGAWVTRSGSSPSLEVGVAASIPDASAVEAGLGILAVRLASAGFDLAAEVDTAWSDPDNDGRLYFDEPGGDPADGELSAAGAGAGLVTSALASGHLDATLRLVARPSTVVDLGDVDVTVAVSAPDLTTDSPQVTVTSGSLASVEAFLTLSTRDLAQGLAQAASTVMALQNATGTGLPFMRGDFANAVGAVEAITTFLADSVPEPTPASPEPGLPDFASLQDMLEDLDAITGTTSVDVAAAAYDAVKKKVAFRLDLTRVTAPAIPLNPAGEAISGTATYTNTQLTDGSASFSSALVGRQVVAGTSSGIVKTVSPTVLTLDPAPVTSAQNPAPTVYWNGGKPVNGTPYSIAAADPKIGAVELGNALEGAASGAIRNANAKVAQATVTPTYTLNLPIVLDLRAPDTTDCDPGPGTAACPFSHTANGITRIIESLPLPADRIMLRTGNTPLLTADAPITTNVDVDATVGFLGVKVKGTLKACTASAPVDATCTGTPATGDNLMTISLKPAAGADADGDISFPSFVAALTNALAASPSTVGDLVDVDVAGQAYANLTVEVPGAPQFFGGSSPTAGVTVTMPDITDPDTFTVTPNASLADLGTFDFDPDNPLALFGAILANLQAVQGMIGDFPGSGALDTEIPLVGKSFNDVIAAGAAGGGAGVSYTETAGQTWLTDTGKTFDAAYVGRDVHVGSAQARVVGTVDGDPHTLILAPAFADEPADGTAYTIDSELQGLINTLQDQSSSSLQNLLDTLAKKLGLGSNATFEVIDGTPDTLKVKLHWVRAYAHQAPLNMSFELPAGTDRSLVGAQGQGLLNVTATGEVDLALLIPLDEATFDDPAAALKVDPTESGVKAGVSVNGDGIKLTANLGPFEASLGNPTGDPGTELQAGLGVELSSAETSAQTLSAFVGGLDVSVTGNGVSCDGAPSGGTDLALCAVFPTYVNGTLAGSDADHGKFVVRLPVGTDLGDTLNLAGPQVGGHDRLVYPDQLLSTLASAALNLASFGEGFYGYMEFLENALRTASFEGKLPLVGKDLQAGSDFVGDLRTRMQTALAGVDPLATNAGQIRTFLKTKVEPEMPRFGAFHFDVECVPGATLATVGKPAVTATNDGDTTALYQYKVVAYANVDGQPSETIPSDASDADQNAATLDATHFNDISWTDGARETGYRIYRSKDGGDYRRIADVAAGTTTYKDEGAADGAALTASTVAPCPDSTPPDEVQGFTMTIDVGQGDPSTTFGCKDAVTADPEVAADDKACLGGQVPFDLGIPGLSVKSTPDTDSVNGIEAKLGWRLHLKVGLNRDDGFFVQTQDSNTPEFLVGAKVDVGDLDARVAFINVGLTNNDEATPELVGAFSIDLKDGPTADDCTSSCSVLDGPGSPRLTLDDLGDASSVGDFVKPVLTADVDIDWHLAARPGTGSAMPGISTDFLMTWGWTSDAPSDFGGLDIAFNNVKIDAGEFLGNAIKPIVKQVVDVFKPVQPVIDTLFEPIPVISDLSEAVGGDPITIATLAQTFSTLAGGPDIQPFLDVLKNVRDLLAALSGDCGTDPAPCITVGSFGLVTSNAVTKDANPATAESMIDTGAGYSVNANVKNDLNAKASRPIDANGADAEHPGFSFPFLDDPSSIFGLLVGQDVELVEFDSGPLTIGFEFQQSFGPVYAPPPVNIVVGGGASVTLRVVAGFDTYGIRTAIEAGKFDAKILDSLYFKTTDDSGKPIPVVQFEGFLQAGASISLVVIEVGVVGGIKLTISFYWNDPNNDGKFRFSEFLATALSNPICLFNVGGELSLFIKVFITLGISPFSVSFDFTLVDVVILDFSLTPDCTPPPPKLGGVDDGVLYLFAGKFGGKAQRAPGYSGAYPFDAQGSADENWVIRQVPAKAATPDPDGSGPKSGQSAENAKVTVTALGITEDFDDHDGAIHTVVLDGRGYAGDLQVTFNGGDKNTPFSKKTVVATGNGDDVIRTGIGAAIVDSGGGADQVTTLERTDLALDPATAPAALVSGGPGVDAITVGNGRDTVLGDRGLVFHDLGTIGTTAADGAAVNVPAPLDPDDVDVPSNPGGNASGDGGDQIAAGLGGSTIYGNGGDDKIGTANDNKQADLPGIANPSFYRAGVNTIVGGGGSDRIKSGSASDFVYTGAQVNIGQDDPGSGDLATDENSVDTGTGSDTVYGSNAKDFVTTHSLTTQTATVYGGGAADVLIGALGTDRLYGGRANDYLVAGPAEVSADFPVVDQLTALGAGNARRVTLSPITPPVSAKTLVGGGGKDRIYGVDGPATIYGDHEVDACARQSDPVSAEPAENPVVSPAPLSDRDDADLILGGAGIDTVQAGGGDDFVYLFANADVACGAGGVDTVFGGTENDLVYGGSGGDKLYGEAHDDELYANTGDDAAYGGTGLDRIQGNAGADFLTGDADTDLVIGGTSKAGEPDTGDRVYGDTGTDTLVGDNADSDVIPAYPADLANLEETPAIGGEDKVFGGEHDDIGYGGLADDEVFGGSGNDHLEGNNASDDVFGEAGADDIIGGSSQAAATGVGRPDAGDNLSGGDNDDVIAGDNAQLAKVADGSPLTKGRDVASQRSITLLDLGYGAATGLFGGDTITGGEHTDVILAQRGADDVHGDGGDDYAEGGPDADTVAGDLGQDDLVGGSYHAHAGTGAGTVGQPDTGDTITGGAQGDVVLGDNGAVLRDPAVPPSDLTRMRGVAERSVQPYDLDGSAQVGVSAGADHISGNADPDVLLGQAGTDRLLAGTESDYAEGGPDADWVEGGDGSDDLVGGSSTVKSGTGTAAEGQPDAGDVLWGQAGDDVATGDNAVLTRVPPFNDLTYRVNGAALITERRALRLLDLSNAGSELTAPHASRFGADQLSGQGGTDVLLGQDGPDAISGGSADDYAEGQGAGDTIYGDRLLAAVGITPPVVAWPGAPTASFGADGGADGQDDLLGGSSRPGFRDAGDTVHGDGVSDFVLGDNGTSVRTVDPVDATTFANRVYTLRYPATLPAGAAVIRHSDPAYVSTRFCTTAQATCEPAGASGGDLLYGEAGDDFVYGQDGDDTVWGGSEDDDIYGELGNDTLFGEDGEDAILGDRGGVRDVYEDGSASKTSSLIQPPALTYTSRRAGSVSRVADLLHDVNGDAFVGSGAGAKMVYDGIAFGGDDRIRGGNGHDNLHGGVGDDLVNGDSGGDTVFGDDGADVLWGGKGCDPAVDTMLTSPDCYASGVFVPEARGTDDRMLDYVFGGKGATSGPSVGPNGSSGSDVIDWRVRGTYAPGTGCTTNPWPQSFGKTTTLDPCSWFEMTDVHDADDANNQHHQGIDWQYGGWDRDVLQADVSDNGPNPGDRLLDWNGAYNLYTHCNAAYGGFNDVREMSPAHLLFIQEWAYGVGAGQTASDVTTAGTSAFVEAAIVYTEDLRQHGSGKAYPSTPGHFDDPNACAP